MKRFFCLGLVVSACGFAQANLVSNGSFEVANGTFVGDSTNLMSLGTGSTTISGWTVFGGSVAWIENQNPTPWYKASDGVRALDLTDTRDGAPYGGVRQDVATVAGQYYIVSFDLGIHSRYSSTICCIQAAAADFQQIYTAEAVSGEQKWFTNTFTFKATSSITQLQFLGALATPADIGLDNVSMVAVPEPSTWLAMGLGVALLARRKR